MYTLLFFAGLCLGSICGFLLALLLLHARAQSIAESLAEERVPLRRAGDIEGGGPAWDPSDEWMYSRPSTASNGVAE